MVYYFPSLTATYSTTSDNNLVYCGTPGALNIIYADGAMGALTNVKQTLAQFKTFVTPREGNSKTENVPFLNTTVGSTANFLHIDPTMSTQVESGSQYCNLYR